MQLALSRGISTGTFFGMLLEQKQKTFGIVFPSDKI